MIPRPNYTEQLRSFIDKPLIKIVTGIRRSGKSTVLRLLKVDLQSSGIKDEQIISINFESFAYSEYTSASQLYDYICKKIVKSISMI